MKKIIMISIGMSISFNVQSIEYKFINAKEQFGDFFVIDINNNDEILLRNNNSVQKLWNETNEKTLNAIIGGDSINDLGHMSGWHPGNHAGYWDGINNKDLGLIGMRGISYANDINNHNYVVGHSSTTKDFQSHATIWNADTGEIKDLGALKHGWNSLALAINDSNQVVGMSETKEVRGGAIEQHAALWQNSKIYDLTGFNGDNNSMAIDINNNHQVLGYLVDNGVDARTSQVIWDVSDINNIKIQFIENAQNANSINDFGDVVGSSLDGYAFLWHDGKMVDLNSFVDRSIIDAGWHLYSAFDINNNGWIAGDARNSITGEFTNFLLIASPVPEPSALLMFLAGIGLIIISSRRKNIRLN